MSSWNTNAFWSGYAVTMRGQAHGSRFLSGKRHNIHDIVMTSFDSVIKANDILMTGQYGSF